MTLACKTADLLTLATHGGGDDGDGEGEKRGEGQGVNGGTEKASEEVARLVAETGRLHAEAEKVARETERAVAETERLKAQAMLARSEKLTTNAATERRKAEPERVTAGTEWVKVEVETVGRGVAKEVQVQEGETPKTGGYMARMEAKIEATPRSMDYYKAMRNEEDERRMADHARKWVEIARMNLERERKKAENTGEETAESHQETGE
ncbi:uncharacterized protein LAJ45_10302 [Morchella importuna]|uniref:uncharacterized protein n=1 Tax=Morchella importuna TaxID=1174673 RepID=UPI001E8DF176|nr:uncharacterized protein LAJ45_10302 [Morchella importuna]KAH8145662.1 hypothetical protein LAJ45_10302 [Morchella importuna]